MTAITVRRRYRFGNCEVDPLRRKLRVAGRPAEVGARAFDVLLALLEHPGDLVTKHDLMARAWPDLVVQENNLAQQVATLRRILGADAIATVPAIGYRLTMPIEGEMARRAEVGVEPIPSIGVLPFADLSAERNQEFFAEGLAEEVLHVMARMRRVRVASRASAFAFKSSGLGLAAIADRLGVTWILQGSVRKSASRIRVSVQLMHAATDSPAWSQTYDRELGDIFAVQDDIAGAVVREIRPALFSSEDGGPSGPSDKEMASATLGRSRDSESHRLYLRGRFFAEKSTPDDLAMAIADLTRATSIDPSAARLWAALARVHATRASFGWGEVNEEFGKARAAALQAIRQEPDLAEGHAALAWIQFAHDWDWRGATTSIRRALDLAPGDAEIVREAAYQVGSLGEPEEAVELARRAVELDPLGLRALRTLAVQCFNGGRLEESERVSREALQLFPASHRTRYHLGRALLLQGRLAEALEAFESESDERQRLEGTTLGLPALGRREEFEAAISRLASVWGIECGFQISEAYAFAGHADRAFEWLNRAIEHRDPGITMCRATPLLRSLHSDPRWPALLAGIGLA